MQQKIRCPVEDNSIIYDICYYLQQGSEWLLHTQVACALRDNQIKQNGAVLVHKNSLESRPVYCTLFNL